MRKRNGFTLIELLAVIVILAVIALIATPIIISVINKAEKGAFENTAYGILDAGKLYYTDKLGDSNSFGGKSFDFTGNIDDLKLSGGKPGGGALVLDSDGKQMLVIYDKGKRWCAVKGKEDAKITMSEYKNGKCEASTAIPTPDPFTKISDMSGNNNHGKGNDVVLSNGEVTLNGRTSYIDAGFAGYDFKNAITMVIRTKCNINTTGNNILMNNFETGGIGFYILSNKTGILQMKLVGGNNYIYTPASNVLTTNQYYTFSLTYDGTTLKYFQNGILIASVPAVGNIKVTPVPIFIGANPQASGNHIEYTAMTMTDALLYNRTLTDVEIKQKFSNKITKQQDNNLLFQYKWVGGADKLS